MLKRILLPVAVAFAGCGGMRGGLNYLDQTPIYSEEFIEYRKLDKRVESAYSRNVFSNPDSTEVYQSLISRMNDLARTNSFMEDIRKEKKEETKRELLPWMIMGSFILFLGGSAKTLEIVIREGFGSRD
ncbi:MAG: hypothetical protein Q8P81_03910 [Nanoarchaeota archaeon]|nr:hypothetical protein [Nanoarchaeota archaeon]